MKRIVALLLSSVLTFLAGAQAQNQSQQPISPVVEVGKQEQATPDLPPMVVPPVTIYAEGAGPVHWILPGPRELSAEVFGTPGKPLGWQEEVGVPVERRLTSEAGTAWTTTAFPTVHSDSSEAIDGTATFNVADITALDGTTTQDQIDFVAEFTGPGQEGQQNTYRVVVTKAIPNGPTHSFSGGVGTNAFLHGSTGLGTMLQPRQFSYAFFWGVGDLYLNGELVADKQIVHVMITQRVRTSIEEGYKLVFTSRVDELKGMGRQIHLILPPQKMTPQGPEQRPVPTGYTLPNGQEQPFIHVMFDTVANISGGLASTAGETGQTAGLTPEAEQALTNVRNVLTQGIGTAPTPQVVEAFRNVRTTLQDDAERQGLTARIETVEQALTAEPFDQAGLVDALQALALEMRIEAGPGDAGLLVEVASLVDQTADYIQNEGYTPRMEVDTP